MRKDKYMTNTFTFTGKFKTENGTETKKVTTSPNDNASNEFADYFTTVCDTNGLRTNNYGTDWATWPETGETHKTIESLAHTFHDRIHTEPETDLATLESIDHLHFIDENTGEEFTHVPNYQ